jgi:HK97 family phage prohead protease
MPPTVELELRKPSIPSRERRDVGLTSCEMREQDGKIVFQGHASVFDRLSEDLGGFRERVQRGAFRKVLDSNPDVRFLFNHDANLIMGRTTNGTLELREDPKGLRVYAELAPTTAAKDLRILVQRGDVDGMSIGFSVNPAEGGRDVWAEEDGELVRTVVAFSELFDVGPVVFPAFPQTDASIRSRVLGVELVSATGDVQADALRSLAWRVHRGEQVATADERSRIDAAFAAIDSVSPWIAERALRAACHEPELRAAIPGKRAAVTIEDEEPESSGDEHRGCSTQLARARLTLIEAE